MGRSFIAGGAGFIGSHLVRELLLRPDQQVVVFDNLTSGREAHLGELLDDERLELIVGDLQDAEDVTRAMAGCDHVYHFAANPDIARAVTEPTIDFWQGTYLTNNLIDAMRINEVPRITYSSGSGVYGDRGDEELDEDFGPLIPVSTYGASKLACEAMIAAYTHMFAIDAVVFRFANVVGPAPDPWRHIRLRAPPAGGSGAAADPGRRQAEQVLHPRQRRGRGDAAAHRSGAGAALTSSMLAPATTSPSQRSPTSSSSAWACRVWIRVRRRRSRLEGGRSRRAFRQRAPARPRLALRA